MKYVLLLYIGILSFQAGAQAKLAGSYGLDQEVQSFLEHINSYDGPPIHELPLDIARGAMENMQKDSTLLYNHVTIQKETFELSKKKANVVIVKPKQTKATLPVLVYFHSGGWAYNSFETHKRLVSDIASGSNIAVVFVEYARTPEATYPTANEEGYLVIQYLSEFGKKHGLHPNKIVVGGGSAGGNMATAITIMAKQRKGPKIDGQLLLYPVTDNNLNTRSYHQFSKGHYLSRSTMKWFWDTYAPDQNTQMLPTVAPLKASKELLSGLPKALIITAEYDVLRDEGEAYAKKLRMAGVPVISARYGGTIHDFVVLNALRHTEASKAALKQACTFLTNTFKDKEHELSFN